MYVGLINQLQPTQSPAMQTPATLVAATTLTPTTFLTNVSGTTNVATITPPVQACHMLALNFTDAAPGSLLTTGNVLIGLTTVTTNRPVLVVYNPVNSKYLVVAT